MPPRMTPRPATMAMTKWTTVASSHWDLSACEALDDRPGGGQAAVDDQGIREHEQPGNDQARDDEQAASRSMSGNPDQDRTEDQVEPDVGHAEEVFEVGRAAADLVDGHPDHAAQEEAARSIDAQRSPCSNGMPGVPKPMQPAEHPAPGGCARATAATPSPTATQTIATSIVSDQTVQCRLYKPPGLADGPESDRGPGCLDRSHRRPPVPESIRRGCCSCRPRSSAMPCRHAIGSHQVFAIERAIIATDALRGASASSAGAARPGSYSPIGRLACLGAACSAASARSRLPACGASPWARRPCSPGRP